MSAGTSAGCRVLFVGAVEEGRRCLEALLAGGERFVGFVTLKEEWAAQTSGAVPFDDLAERYGVPLLKVRDLNHPANVERVRALGPDLILVIGWTRLVGPEILKIPSKGSVGFHASMLPKYGGRAPVNWAIINGEMETGNTMFFLDGGVDTGDIIAQRKITIDEDDTCATLYRKVSDAAIEMLRQNLPLLKEGRAPRRPQERSQVTLMPKRTPEDGLIDWSKDCRALYNWVRALTHPYPGAFTQAGPSRLFIWRAAADPGARGGAPGEVLAVEERSLLVATGGGGLRILSAQVEGEPEDEAGAVARRHRWAAGTRLGGPVEGGTP